ncbi:MAG: hypothetical protein ACYC9M_02695 [Desulfobulbaceae bacterium]
MGATVSIPGWRFKAKYHPPEKKQQQGDGPSLLTASILLSFDWSEVRIFIRNILISLHVGSTSGHIAYFLTAFSPILLTREEPSRFFQKE